MKKILFCLMVCAGLAACTSDDVVISSGTTDFEGGDIYMKVYISDVKDGSTRATGTATGADDKDYNVYENGLAGEYEVNDAEFYFYDEDGVFISRASVWDGENGTTNTDGNSVTFKSANVIVLKGLTARKLPKYMVTILNEPSGFEDDRYDPANTLAELEQKLVEGYTTAGTDASGESKNYFIMSTSSYTSAGTTVGDETTGDRTAANKHYFVTEIDDSNFTEEPIDEKTSDEINAVQVYVERLAAKVSVDTSIESSTTGRLTDDEESTSRTFYLVEQSVAGTANDDGGLADIGIDGIYVTFLGWTLNGTARKSYMMKNVDDEWDGTYWQGDWKVDTYTWNDENRYRSYWGKGYAYGTGNFPTTNYQSIDVDEDGNLDFAVQTDDDEKDSSTWFNEYLKYTSLNGDLTQIGSDSAGDAYAEYCHENTNIINESEDESAAGIMSQYSSGITSVLLKAQACTKNDDGTYDPLALVRYEGELFTADEFKNTIVRQEVNFDFENGARLASEELGMSEILAGYMQSMYDCFEPEIYCTTSALGSSWDATSDSLFVFDGSFLNLVDIGNGNVGVWPATTTAYHGTTQPEASTTGEPWVQKALSDYWKGQAIEGYKATRNLDNYQLYFKIKEGSTTTLSNVLSLIDLAMRLAGSTTNVSGDIINTTDGDYLFMDNDNAWITGVNSGSYTLRQYFIRAIEKEALQTNLYFLGYELDQNNAGNDDTYVESGYGEVEANFYKDGLMYYSIPIEHLVEKTESASTEPDAGEPATEAADFFEGQYGVVRNHWYQLEITSLSKLGKGISDETAVIIPDPNGTDYLSVVANININAWQTVKQQKGL